MTVVDLPVRCVRCGAPVTFWMDTGWVHDDRERDRPYCWNAEGPVLRWRS